MAYFASPFMLFLLLCDIYLVEIEVWGGSVLPVSFPDDDDDDGSNKPPKDDADPDEALRGDDLPDEDTKDGDGPGKNEGP